MKQNHHSSFYIPEDLPVMNCCLMVTNSSSTKPSGLHFHPVSPRKQTKENLNRECPANVALCKFLLSALSSQRERYEYQCDVGCHSGGDI